MLTYFIFLSLSLFAILHFCLLLSLQQYLLPLQVFALQLTAVILSLIAKVITGHMSGLAGRTES